MSLVFLRRLRVEELVACTWFKADYTTSHSSQVSLKIRAVWFFTTSLVYVGKQVHRQQKATSKGVFITTMKSSVKIADPLFIPTGMGNYIDVPACTLLLGQK